MTVEAENETLETLRQVDGLIVGATSANDVSDIDFVDYPFTVPDVTWQDHVDTVKDQRPKIAVSPDVMEGDDPDERLDQADELLQYAETVIIVPKSIHPEEVPDRFRVGIPSQVKFGAGAPWSLWEYRNCRSVHLLGGAPRVQIKAKHHVRIGSVDTNSPLKAAKYGDVWTTDGWEERSGIDYYDRAKLSYTNLVNVWK